MVQIRNVSEDARRVLKSRAAARGESLNSYLLGLISREVSRPTVAEVLERASGRTEQSGASSVEAIDAERRGRDTALPRSTPA